MFINNIQLNNYRIYKGACSIDFLQDESRNIYIISGNNGYGKTSFLTSLVWCFYGKNMIDVEKKYREDVYDSGGYKKYAKSNLNISAKLDGSTDYSVSITISDLFIPSVPCERVEIIRSYDISKDQEKLVILIDGAENELTKEVGNEIFINDFILPREIAKFFFFDAEKIVALAEVTSIEDKRALSYAYSEVLGIKKYEDLKNNLIDLRTRLRRTNVSDENSQKLDQLQKQIDTQKEVMRLHTTRIQNLKEELDTKKVYSEQLQERLIREGNALTVKELAKFKEEKKRLIADAEKLKIEMSDLLELAPFALSANVLMKVADQISVEQVSASDILSSDLKSQIQSRISRELSNAKLSRPILEKMEKVVELALADIVQKENRSSAHLLELEAADKNLFSIVVNKLKYSYSITFREVSKAYRTNRTQFAKVVRRLSEAEAKENDLLIKELRIEKTKIDDRIHEIYREVASIEAMNEGINRDIITKQKVASQIESKIKLFSLDLEKDETAARLVNELQLFINKLKAEKKKSLEENIRLELNQLMHKRDFVNRVEVRLDNDLIDILLYGRSGEMIEKEKLSKGEQQLYATALLKALVNESNFKFPVFIDSPLQKFDRMHSDRIITEFYPSISDQVVLFPLLEKELSEREYQKLSKKVAAAYLIKNFNGEYSFFESVATKNLFTSYNVAYDTVK
ncbi:MAG: DNA sulfur modification protein DndD [Proteobacteria bacterium]|nr:MAG: DNA sulfur modification protein DndD [Pseudomonadota bacterium]